MEVGRSLRFIDFLMKQKFKSKKIFRSTKPRSTFKIKAFNLRKKSNFLWFYVWDSF